MENKIVPALVLSLFALALFVKIASAQEKIQTLTLTPFILEEKMEKGQTIRRTMELANQGQEALTLSAQPSDFVQGSTEGHPVFVTKLEPGEEKYALSSWMKVVSPSQITIQPGGRASVSVEIAVPSDAEEGSRYGGVLFTYSAAAPQAAGSEVIKKTATLFFIKVGNANEQGGIKSFSSNKFATHGKVNFNLQFNNTGNVHLKPKGTIQIYNLFGRMVASVPVNPNASIVLPNTERGFDSVWKTASALGFYRAEAHIYFGENKYEATASSIFWMFPIKTILVMLLILAILFVALRFAIKAYNQKVLDRAGLGKKKPSNKKK